jgi:hypothetical protein
VYASREPGAGGGEAALCVGGEARVVGGEGVVQGALVAHGAAEPGGGGLLGGGLAGPEGDQGPGGVVLGGLREGLTLGARHAAPELSGPGEALPSASSRRPARA